jgi:hypothetical protein
LRLVFVRPAGTSNEWARTDLYRSAEQIPTAIVSADENGSDAARFGVTTSGEALLYAADGKLLFHGGITPSRGHEGDNAGRSAIASIIQCHPANYTQSAVFGCSLFSHSEPATKRQSDANTLQPHD